MPSEFDPAIAAMERRREEALAGVADLERTINHLCKEAGYPPRYNEATVSNATKVTQISDDTFYGMKQTPAMRAYLEMRKAQGLGPANTREIYDALVQGGYQFESKTPDIAMVGMRALLRTQPLVFHRLPQGTWGLAAWYPDAKKPKEEAKKKTAPAKKARAASKLRKAPSPGKRRSSPQHPKGEEETDVDHQPDITE
ncbi:hypothetical protein ABIB06_004710 [Bradyrhizobium sp. LB8.2]|uniref:hypothetical protein n=1 Tax=unclassified Bradyrhizobium TaxID=2631580 RepID=UPI00339A8A3F